MSDTAPRAAHRRAARFRSQTASGGWSTLQITWPIVALVGMVLGAIVAILVLVPADDPQGRSVVMLIVQALVTVFSALFVARRVENSVNDRNNSAEEPEQTEQPPRSRSVSAGEHEE